MLPDSHMLQDNDIRQHVLLLNVFVFNCTNSDTRVAFALITVSIAMHLPFVFQAPLCLV